MPKSNRWIVEIQEMLQTFDAGIKMLNDFSCKIKDQLLIFIPANTSKLPRTKNAVIIHEDLFHTRKNQLLMRLKSRLGLNAAKVHGRSTRVKEITKSQAEKFVDENHLMGFGGGKTFLGLYQKEVLVSVAVFSKIRLMKYENPAYNSVELERYCSLPDTTVVGGLDKLIRHFEKNYETDDIVTTVDLEWSQGKSYLKLGFETVARTKPILFAADQKKFTRRVIVSETDLKASEYLIQNRGNLKLQKRITF